MARFTFKLPDIGEGIAEAEIVAWKVSVGDTVEVNDILLEVETAKSLVELPCPVAGTVLALLVGEGDMVDVGTPIIRIGEPGEAPDGTPDGAQTTTGPEVAGELQDSNGEPVDPKAPVANLVGYGAKPGAIARRSRSRTCSRPPATSRSRWRRPSAASRPCSCPPCARCPASWRWWGSSHSRWPRPGSSRPRSSPASR